MIATSTARAFIAPPRISKKASEFLPIIATRAPGRQPARISPFAT